MPGRPLLFEFRCRNETICRTCLLNLRQPQAPRAQQQPWLAASYSSTASRGRIRPRARAQPTARRSAFQRPTKAELEKKLDTVSPPKDEVPESHDYNVRLFEQEGDKLTELPDDGTYAQSVEGTDASMVKHAFSQVTKLAHSQSERAAIQEVMGKLGSTWENMKSEGDLEKVIQTMDDYGDSVDKEIEETIKELPEELQGEFSERFRMLFSEDASERPASRASPIPQIPTQAYTANQRKKISRLNAAIDRVYREMQPGEPLTSKQVSSIYKAYHASRLSLAHSWSSMPVDVWDFLWLLFSANESINPHRLAHVSLLARDMADAKVTLSPTQQLVVIEAVFVEGWEAKALDNWKRCMPTLGDESAQTFQDFWELGVRMHCRTGDMVQVQRAMKKLLDNDSDPRILMPVIRTYSERGTVEDHQQAWELYRRMRELLGQNMKLSDYDQVVSYFLTTSQTENALYAFVDMMSDGQIDLTKQKYMPSVVANKFFLGKWLKRLIGAGDLDGAYSVVEFMRQKGVPSAPIHLNGLIGAWQRAGGSDNMDKADALAWDMIQARIDFVRARKEGKAHDLHKEKGFAPLPRATLETFSIVAENYRVRNLHQSMNELWDAFREAEISPDAFMMNQLLESYVQAGQINQAKNMYEELVHKRGLQPDPYTFSTLWKTLGINQLHHIPAQAMADEAANARRLFAEMAKHQAAFAPEGLDGQLARKILHTFRRIKDDAGFLVALTTFKELFGFLPPEALVLEMNMGTTRLAWDAPNQRRRLMGAKRNLDQELLRRVDNNPSKLEGQARSVALYEYLQRKYWPSGSDPSEVFKVVAKEMGVYDKLVQRTTPGQQAQA